MKQPLAFCLCADDYAMTPGVSAGILEALDAGALSATSVMTTSPWWPELAAPLRRHADMVDIGLHLNLTLGEPLTPMPALAPQGRLPDIRTLIRLDRSRALPAEEIATEIDRQCGQFAEVFGRPPDHVDGHQHVHVLRSIRPLVLDALDRRNWHPWLRDSSDRPWRLPWREGVKKALAVSYLADGFERQANHRGFGCNSGFAGFSSFDASASYAKQFASYLRMPGPRHLVMCHPGYVDDELRRLDPVLDTREQELRYLTSEFTGRIGRGEISLRRISAFETEI